MSTLDSLIRVHRWRLDEQRRRVAELDQLGANLRAELQRLDAEQVAEQEAATKSTEAAFAYGNYAGAVIARRLKLSQSLADADQQVTKAREALAEVFQELKRYEIAAAKRLLNQRIQADRIQPHEMDDLGGAIHQRAIRPLT